MQKNKSSMEFNSFKVLYYMTSIENLTRGMTLAQTVEFSKHFQTIV